MHLQRITQQHDGVFSHPVFIAGYKIHRIRMSLHHQWIWMDKKKNFGPQNDVAGSVMRIASGKLINDTFLSCFSMGLFANIYTPLSILVQVHIVKKYHVNGVDDYNNFLEILRLSISHHVYLCVYISCDIFFGEEGFRFSKLS
ncbi:hypothetical protein ACJX0J_005947 [Zea mays]